MANNAEEGKESAESILAEIQKRITDAFSLFDNDSNETVDVREIGTIIRSLGCCPSEAELHDILGEIEEEDPTGYIKLERFLPMMTRVLMERRYKPAPESHLLKAFMVLDIEGKGYLTTEELSKFMKEEGEPFTEDEMKEMLGTCVYEDSSNVVQYKDFVSLLTVEET